MRDKDIEMKWRLARRRVCNLCTYLAIISCPFLGRSQWLEYDVEETLLEFQHFGVI